MASLLVEDVPVPLLARRGVRAAADQRTLNRHIVWLLEQALQLPPPSVTAAAPSGREAQRAPRRGLAGQRQGSATVADTVIADLLRRLYPVLVVEERGAALIAAAMTGRTDLATAPPPTGEVACVSTI